jgi:hypothetical protein
MVSPSPTETTVAEGKLTLATVVGAALVLVAWGSSTVVEQAARVARDRRAINQRVIAGMS